MSAIRLYVAEALEPRMLLAAHPAHPAYSADYLPNGVLNVNGNPRQANVIVVQVETAAPDQFVVFIDGSPVPIAGAPAVTPTPTPASSPTPTPSPIPAGFGVEASLVSLIVVRGGSQGDNIQIGETDANGITTGVPSYIVGGAGDDTLTGGSGNDTIFGGPGNDVISDGSGSDVIDGGSGNDIIRAGDGNDTITGDVGNDIITVQAPQTAVLTTQPSDFLDGGAGNDVILAGVGDDLLFGGPGNDSLVGGSGNDTMLGGAGRDTLVGGTGHDEMFGGPGKDQFVGLATLDVVEDHQVGEGPLQKTANTTPTPTPTTSPSGTIATAKAGDGSVQTAGGHAGGIGDPVITYVISTGAVNSFLIQDSIGAIEVSDSTYMPAVGNTVGVTGQVTSPNGLYQFEGPTSVTTTGSTMTQPAAQTFTAATLTNGSSAGLAQQSELGNLASATFSATGNFASGTYTVTSPGNAGTAAIVVPIGSSLIGTAVPTASVNLYGYLSQDDSSLAGSAATSSNGFELVIISITPTPTPTPTPNPTPTVPSLVRQALALNLSQDRSSPPDRSTQKVRLGLRETELR